MSLEEKQAYYRYAPGAIEYKDPPALSDEVQRALKSAKLDKHYRFIWLGVAVVRETPTDLNPVVKGDKRATQVMQRPIGFREENGAVKPDLVPWREPKVLAHRVRQQQDWFYIDDDLHKVRVARPDLCAHPDMVLPNYTYVDYGALLWRIEYLASGNDPQPKENHWICIETIKSPDGLYQEPDLGHVVGLEKREYQNRNENLDEVVKADIEERFRLAEEKKAKQEAAERKAFNKWADAIIEEAQDTSVSVFQS